MATSGSFVDGSAVLTHQLFVGDLRVVSSNTINPFEVTKRVLERLPKTPISKGRVTGKLNERRVSV